MKLHKQIKSQLPQHADVSYDEAVNVVNAALLVSDMSDEDAMVEVVQKLTPAIDTLTGDQLIEYAKLLAASDFDGKEIITRVSGELAGMMLVVGWLLGKYGCEDLFDYGRPEGDGPLEELIEGFLEMRMEELGEAVTIAENSQEKAQETPKNPFDFGGMQVIVLENEELPSPFDDPCDEAGADEDTPPFDPRSEIPF